MRGLESEKEFGVMESKTMPRMSGATSALEKAHWLRGLTTLGTAALITIVTLWRFDDSPIERSPSRVFEGARAPRSVPNGTVRGANISNSEQPPSKSLQWIRFPAQENATQTILRRLGENGTLPCHDVKTSRIEIAALPIPDGNKPVVLRAGFLYKFVMVAYDDRGKRRCAGGDYFETDLAGPSWKSRPPVSDFGNGSYSLELQVDPRFVGLYLLKIVLLYGNYNGLRWRPQGWARMKMMGSLNIKFVSNGDGSIGPPLNRCKAGSDYGLDAWSGRWTRARRNELCDINSKGAFQCLDPDEPCSMPWCDGPVGSLHSNGWVYSAHCSFKIFRQEEAWDCLDKRWLFFWGDSNHFDTIRNMLNFALGLWGVKSVPRRFDRSFKHPTDGSRWVRITSIYNGHVDVTKTNQGLFSLTYPAFRKLLGSFFEGDSVPDTMIMNSGVHDGSYWKNVSMFTEGVEIAAEFWESVMRSVVERQRRKPLFLYRTTVATAGVDRARQRNAQKMEIFNRIVLEKLRERNLVSSIVDAFDLTFPWHFDNKYSDGAHYGGRRRPARRPGGFARRYFVDLMLVHILLNAICT